MTQDGPSRYVYQPRRHTIRWGMILGGLGVLAACGVVKYYWGAEPAHADSPWRLSPTTTTAPSVPAAQPTGSSAPASVSGLAAPTPAAAAVAPTQSSGKAIPQIVAIVNGHEISREELGRECILHCGKEVLDSMINKELIVEQCRQQGITITRDDVDREIQRMAKRFGLPVDQWLKLLKQERNIDVEQYASDIIWPTLALRRLAGDRLAVSRQELEQYFEMSHGEKVRARLIACRDPRMAQKVQALAASHPEDFGNLAKQYSEDVNSASVKGIIQPICKHGAYKEIEQVAFQMADGEVSPVIQAGGQFVILKREKLLPADSVKLEEIEPKLAEVLREKKMHAVANDVFDQLKKRSRVEVVLSNPARQQQLPGIAAVVNGTQITVRQLAEESIARHGADILEGAVGRKLVDMACQQHHVSVSEQEIDQEVARVASLMVRSLPDGRPDVDGFIKMVAEKQGISAEVYRRDNVWPSVALRKLVHDKITITEEDMRNGYEANYGPRVRCRAIVLGQFRRANEVFEKARANPTLENFGKLAAEYSIEGTSRVLEGEVPPIARHSGQPNLEHEAFALKKGEMSGVIQLGDKWVILFCEGYTEPEKVDFAQVRDLIYEDIHEKKQHLAMADFFENLQNSATIDNFLTGKTQSPAKAGDKDPAGRLPTLREVPGKDG